MFPSAVNRGSDYGYISYSDSNYSGGERARLRIGTSNDGDDDIILQPTGDVGINNDNPSEKLDVTGNIKASGRITGNDADFDAILSGGYAQYKFYYSGMLNSVWRRFVGPRFSV